jgi:hypothetical protein
MHSMHYATNYGCTKPSESVLYHDVDTVTFVSSGSTHVSYIYAAAFSQ